MNVFKSSNYSENFISNYFQTFLDNKYRIQEKVIIVPKKPLFLVLPYLGLLSLQTRTNLRKSLKGVLKCCKLQTVSTIGLCNQSFCGECVRHLNVRIGEHIGISLLTKKEKRSRKRRKLSLRLVLLAIILLLCNHSLSFENFSVLTRE